MARLNEKINFSEVWTHVKVGVMKKEPVYQQGRYNKVRIQVKRYVAIIFAQTLMNRVPRTHGNHSVSLRDKSRIVSGHGAGRHLASQI